MKEYVFRSSLADRMKAFVALKRLSGNKYKTQTLILKYFDQFLIRKKFNSKYVTRNIYEQYVATLSHLHPRYRSDQCSVIRQFSIYLSRFEPHSHIPDPVPSGRSHDAWRAFIFTKPAGFLCQDRQGRYWTSMSPCANKSLPESQTHPLCSSVYNANG